MVGATLDATALNGNLTLWIRLVSEKAQQDPTSSTDYIPIMINV